MTREVFIDEAMKQLLYKFGLSKEKPDNFNALTMVILLHITAYQYDDRNSLSITEKELRGIVHKCLLEQGDPRLLNIEDPATGLKIGRMRTSRRVRERLNSLYEVRYNSPEDYYAWGKEFVTELLKNTRHAVAHGLFELDNLEGIDVVRIINTRQNFATTYEIGCLVDSCEDVSDPRVKEVYKELLDSIMAKDNSDRIFSLDDEKNKLMFFDLLINILINHNEALVYDSSSNYREAIKRLYRKKIPRFVTTITDDTTVRKVRDSATHHYREMDKNNPSRLLVIDYEKKDDEIPKIVIPVPFEDIVKFAKAFSIHDVIRKKSELDLLEISRGTTKAESHRGEETDTEEDIEI